MPDTASQASDPSQSQKLSQAAAVPHTQIHALMRRALENLQDVVVFLLLVLLLFLSLQALWRLGHMALKNDPTSELLSEIIYILIL
ncbi:MAG TPA: hypothetical protein VG099_06135, partial [Gemmataceae bacterium]|nr:hypothetical protein [Gemmataceae bacterium]